MLRHLHGYHALIVLVLLLIGVSLYHQAKRPVTQGYALAATLREEGFAACLRPALPIVDHMPATSSNAADILSTPAQNRHSLEYNFSRRQSDPQHPEIHVCLGNKASISAIVKALDRAEFYHDYSIKAVREALERLKALPDEQLFNRLITTDITLLEKCDDLPTAIESALLLAALHPTGAAGCIKTPTQSLYVLTLADDNSTNSPNNVLALYAFTPAGREHWTGTLEVPRTWTPDKTFALLDDLMGQ